MVAPQVIFAGAEPNPSPEADYRIVGPPIEGVFIAQFEDGTIYETFVGACRANDPDENVKKVPVIFILTEYDTLSRFMEATEVAIEFMQLPGEAIPDECYPDALPGSKLIVTGVQKFNNAYAYIGTSEFYMLGAEVSISLLEPKIPASQQ